MKKWLPFVALFAVVAALFTPFIFQGKLPVPADAISALYHPYRDFFQNEFPKGYPFKNFLITDPLRQQYPWREISVASIKSFELPLWNPYNGAGEPLLANIQSGVFYPLNFLFFIFPFEFAWGFLIMLQPLLAGVFLYLYLINLKLSNKASVIGALAFAFSGFNTAWLEWGTVVHAGLWLPLILLSIDKILHRIKNQELRIKDKKFLGWSLIFIFSLSSSLFAGHLQTFFYVFIFTQIYFFARWFSSGKKIKILIFYSILNALFLILSSVQWMPTLSLIQESARDIDQLWQKEGWFIPVEHLVQFFAPDFFGNPSTQNYWGTWNYGEMTGYIGLLPVLLVFTALFYRRDKKTLFFSVASVAAIIMATPNFLSRLPFVYQIPFVSTAQPTRLIFVVSFSLSILAALGFDYFEKYKKSVFLPFLVVISVITALWLVGLGHLQAQVTEPENLQIIKSNLKLPTLILFASAVFIAGYFIFPKNKKILPLIFVGIFMLTAFDMVRFSSKFNTFSEPRLLFPQTRTVKFLEEQSKDYPWRFLAVDYVDDQKRIFAPNLSALHRIYTLDTYNPLLLKRYQEFAGVSEWGFTDIPDFSFNRSIILNNYESPLVDFMGVKYIAAITDIESDSLEFLFREKETRVYENMEVFERAYMVDDVVVLKDKRDIARKIFDEETDLRQTAVVEEELPVRFDGSREINAMVEIVDYAENSIEMNVVSDEDGLLVLTDTFYPTWRVSIDGVNNKIYRTNYGFRGVIVPKGNHRVVFTNSLL